ncbi:MAG: restriction endonuclease subunit S [Phycisphaeraceae bacterium]|nr:restriction endonuclease subunit S [Phycisphaeraceae bacterium]
MSLIRKLNNGKWSKPPVLAAARLVLAKGLSKRYPSRQLGNMAEFVNGTSYDRGRLEMGDKPIIRISNISDPASEFIKTDEEFPQRYHVSTGDLLVSWSASFKSILWPGPEGILNQHIFKVTETNGHVRSYIRHAIEAAFDAMQQNVVGIGMMHLRRKDFLGHEVPCPPADVQNAVAKYLDWIESGGGGDEPALPSELEEQRRIVAKIEHLAARIDEAHGLRVRSLDEVNVMYAAACRQVFVANDREVTVEQALGRKALKNGKSLKEMGHPGGVRCLRLSAMQDGQLDLTDSKPVPMFRTEATEYLVRKGDVYVLRGNGSKDLVGRAALALCEDGRTIFPDLFIRVPLDGSGWLPEFFVACWNSPLMRRHITDAAKTTSGIWKINQGHIASFAMPLPPVEEQRRIVTYLDGLQANVDRLKALQQKTAAELDALLPSILDKAFKGEL